MGAGARCCFSGERSEISFGPLAGGSNITPRSSNKPVPSHCSWTGCLFSCSKKRRHDMKNLGMGGNLLSLDKANLMPDSFGDWLLAARPECHSRALPSCGEIGRPGKSGHFSLPCYNLSDWNCLASASAFSARNQSSTTWNDSDVPGVRPPKRPHLSMAFHWLSLIQRTERHAQTIDPMATFFCLAGQGTCQAAAPMAALVVVRRSRRLLGASGLNAGG